MYRTPITTVHGRSVVMRERQFTDKAEGVPGGAGADWGGAEAELGRRVVCANMVRETGRSATAWAKVVQT